MTNSTLNRRKPAIMLARTDHDRLVRLAESLPDGPVVEELLAELDRAKVVADNAIGPNVVRMGSTLAYSTNTGDSRTVTLVFPGEADIAEGKISIITPIGAALIGLSAGQSIDWTARDGHTHRLTVERVDEIETPPSQASALEPAGP